MPSEKYSSVESPPTFTKGRTGDRVDSFFPLFLARGEIKRGARHDKGNGSSDHRAVLRRAAGSARSAGRPHPSQLELLEDFFGRLRPVRRLLLETAHDQIGQSRCTDGRCLVTASGAGSHDGQHGL
jgi:hypothetical protein